MPIRTEKIIPQTAKLLSEKLNEEIDRGNDTGAFMIAVFLAGMKDVIDIALYAVIIGIFPIIGQIPGIFISAFLTFFLWGKGWFLRTRLRVAWWGLGFFVDNLPVFNTLPIQTLAVLYAWHIVRKRAEAAEKKLGNLNALTSEEIKELTENIEILDQE